MLDETIEDQELRLRFYQDIHEIVHLLGETVNALESIDESLERITVGVSEK